MMMRDVWATETGEPRDVRDRGERERRVVGESVGLSLYERGREGELECVPGRARLKEGISVTRVKPRTGSRA